MPREWYVSEALRSWRRLNEILHELTVEELESALEIEYGSKRRRSMIKRLTSRIAAISHHTHVVQLEKEYLNGTR